MKSQNALEDNNVRSVHRLCLTFPAVCHKIVNRNLHFTALLEFGEHIQQQFDVKGIRVIEVILVDQGLFVLLLIQNLKDI